jgi:hypothetical protein
MATVQGSVLLHYVLNIISITKVINMVTRNYILSLFLFTGLVIFAIVGIMVVTQYHSLGDFTKYLFGSLFATVGAAIALLLDVQIPQGTTEPQKNDKESGVGKFLHSLSLTNSKDIVVNAISLGYTLLFIVFGCISIYISLESHKIDIDLYTDTKLIKLITSGIEYIKTIATTFSGIIIAIVGKYAYNSIPQ